MMDDSIVDIPENRVKFFGTTGKMLLPSTATVAALLKQIPENKLVTTTALREHLTAQFNVEGTCPVTTKKALQAIAQEAPEDVAYWRVVNQDGGLISALKEQEEYLSREGFTITDGGKVDQYKDCLFKFD